MERFLNEETIQGSRTRVRRVKRVLYGLVILTAALFTALCLLTNNRMDMGTSLLFSGI